MDHCKTSHAAETAISDNVKHVTPKSKSTDVALIDNNDASALASQSLQNESHKTKLPVAI